MKAWREQTQKKLWWQKLYVYWFNCAVYLVSVDFKNIYKKSGKSKGSSNNIENNIKKSRKSTAQKSNWFHRFSFVVVDCVKANEIEK